MSESKNDNDRSRQSKDIEESKGQSNNDTTDLIEKVQIFCTSNNLETKFESFAEEHKNVFLGMIIVILH